MRLAIFLSFFCLGVPSVTAAFSISPGHFYTTTEHAPTINQYDSNRTLVGSIDVGTYVTGITFGPDGLLYAVTPAASGFSVVGINSSGNIASTYASSWPQYFLGNSGKIAVSDQHIYIAGGDMIMRFTKGQEDSATLAYHKSELLDLEILPNGNLLLATSHEIEEVTPAGGLVKRFWPSGASFTNIQGVEFDPKTEKLFVSHLGHTGFFHQIMRFDWHSGELEANVAFNYPSDLSLTHDGKLLVGSTRTSPRLYGPDFSLIGEFGGPVQPAVTHYPVPEPSGGTMTGIVVAVGVCTSLTRRSRRFHCL